VNPYLAKLRELEKGIPEAPSKLTKPGYVGFVGEGDICFSENGAPEDTPSEGIETPKNTTPANPQNRQNPLCSALTAVESACPEHVPEERWRDAVADARRFLAEWGEQAVALGWTTDDLFGLAPIPDRPKPSFERLSRYDLTGLVWLLRGRRVIALTEITAVIETASGTLAYRRHNKPALGPLGDSIDDFTQQTVR